MPHYKLPASHFSTRTLSSLSIYTLVINKHLYCALFLYEYALGVGLRDDEVFHVSATELFSPRASSKQSTS